MKARVALLTSCLIAAACSASSALLVGRVRAPIAAAQVKIYWSAPPAFEEIAALNVASKSLLLRGGERQTEKIIEHLRQQAARLGANGVLMEEFSDTQILSLGTGIGTETYSRNSDISIGVGGWFGIFKRSGRGRAIFVPP